MILQKTNGGIRQRGFTLIEVLVVVVILGILAAIVVPNVMNKTVDAKIAKVKADLRAIESALNMYRLDNHDYPSTDDGLQALVSKYLPRTPKDPWDRPYVYLSPGAKGEFDIYSQGRDGAPGGEGEDADIGNWDQ